MEMYNGLFPKSGGQELDEINRGRPSEIMGTIEATSETNDTPFLPAYEVEKPYEKYTLEQKESVTVDERAFTLLTMALPNDMYARVDSLTSAKGGLERY